MKRGFSKNLGKLFWGLSKKGRGRGDGRQEGKKSPNLAHGKSLGAWRELNHRRKDQNNNPAQTCQDSRRSKLRGS